VNHPFRDACSCRICFVSGTAVQSC
jgi:hypothetical protein